MAVAIAEGRLLENILDEYDPSRNVEDNLSSPNRMIDYDKIVLLAWLRLSDTLPPVSIQRLDPACVTPIAKAYREDALFRDKIRAYTAHHSVETRSALEQNWHALTSLALYLRDRWVNDGAVFVEWERAVIAMSS